MNRRKLLQLTGVSLGFTVSGCLGIDPPQDQDTDPDLDLDQSENRSSGLDTNTETARTPDPDSDLDPDESETQSFADINAEARQTLDPDHSIQIQNELSEPVTVTATVIREPTGETVHNRTYTLQPFAIVTAYNTRQANPESVEEFTVSVTANGSTDSFLVKTNNCMQDLKAQVTKPDGIDWVYTIC